VTGDKARRISAIDSHTGGEPTRVVIDGCPDLGDGPLAGRLDLLRGRHDSFRSAVANEPRGSDVMVGALLLPPSDPACACAVIFFNNVGYLGMCGHGSIGVVTTLAHLGKISAGDHRLETPAGVVTARLHADGRVSIRNVPSYRLAKNVEVQAAGIGSVVGDVAWGGNWFFLVGEHGQALSLDRVGELTDFTWRVRLALAAAEVTGRDGAEIDHVELFGPPSNAYADSRSFVLCPGGAYDRSPCGTGTSAKLACLHADGKIAAGQIWRQESITGSVFEGSVELDGGLVVPTITGQAWVNAEITLLIDPADPLCWGIRKSV
jgi:4-hydroxyproline epimerase